MALDYCGNKVTYTACGKHPIPNMEIQVSVSESSHGMFVWPLLKTELSCGTNSGDNIRRGCILLVAIV